MIHYHTSHFSVDAEHGKACNLHVAKRFSTEGIDLILSPPTTR